MAAADRLSLICIRWLSPSSDGGSPLPMYRCVSLILSGLVVALVVIVGG